MAAEKEFVPIYALIEKKKYEAALLGLNELIEKKKSPEAFVLKGVCLARIGKTEEAIEAFSLALELSDEYFARVERGKLYLLEFRAEAAREDFERALEFGEREKGEAPALLGLAHWLEGDFESAFFRFSQAYAENPGFSIEMLSLLLENMFDLVEVSPVERARLREKIRKLQTEIEVAKKKIREIRRIKKSGA